MKPRTVPALKARRDLIPRRRYRGDQDADQFAQRAVERLAGATFRSDGTPRKTTKCDIEKLTPKAATIETNFATNTLAYSERITRVVVATTTPSAPEAAKRMYCFRLNAPLVSRPKVTFVFIA